MVKLIFWVSALLLIFPYVIYPALLRLAPKRRRTLAENWEPEVTIIIAAYNEADEIARKLDNTLSLDYPRVKRRVIVASDCSDDGTDDIVRSYADSGVELVMLDTRGGKTAAQNAALEHASGEVIVYTDCGTILDRDALRHLVAPLSDLDTACAGGYLEFPGDGNAELARRKKRMTDFDQHLKQLESDADSLVGVNGSLYAWRHDIAQPLPAHITSDLAVPLETIAAGRRVAFADKARGYEPIAASEQREFARKIRTARAGITVAREYLRLFFDFSRPWVALALWGHKGLRWLGLPLLFLVLITSSIASEGSAFFTIIHKFQLLFYLACIFGWAGALKGSLRLPYYFLFLNIAAFVALVQSFIRPPSEKWETGTQ